MNTLVSCVCAVVAAASIPVRALTASERLQAEDYLNLLRIDLRAAKAKLVVEALELTEEEAAEFLPIYRRYDELLSKLNTARINQLRSFTANYASIDDEQARRISDDTFSFLHRRLDLLQKYTKRIEKVTSPRVAARFAQIENQLLMLIDVQLASDLPLIPRSPWSENEGG